MSELQERSKPAEIQNVGSVIVRTSFSVADLVGNTGTMIPDDII